MRLTLRVLLVIPLAYVLACFAAAFTFVLAVIGLGPDFAYVLDRLPETALLAAGVAVVAGAYGTLPGLLAILLGEVFAWRSVYPYLLAGLAAGLAAAVGPAAIAVDPAPDVAPSALLAAGAVGGFVYWLFAGRDAGTPRRPSRSTLAGEGRPQSSSSPVAGEGRPQPSSSPVAGEGREAGKDAAPAP